MLMDPVAAEDLEAVQQPADRWRAEHRLIDLHQHLDHAPGHLARAVKIMDEVGLGVVVSLGTGRRGTRRSRAVAAEKGDNWGSATVLERGGTRAWTCSAASRRAEALTWL